MSNFIDIKDFFKDNPEFATDYKEESIQEKYTRILSHARDMYREADNLIMSYPGDSIFNVLNFEELVKEVYRHQDTNIYKLFVELLKKNYDSFINYLTTHQYVLDILIKVGSCYYSMIRSFDYRFNNLIIKRYKEYVLNNSENISIEFKNNLEFIMGEFSTNYLISYYLENPNDEVIPVFFRSKKFLDYFVQNDSRLLDFIINRKVSIDDLIFHKFKLPDELLRSDIFFDTLVKDNVIGATWVDRRKRINQVIESQQSYFLYEKFRNYESSLIESGSLSLEELQEVVVDYLFEDNIYNMKLNINEMLRFQNKINEVLIDEDRYNLYKQVFNISSLTEDELLYIYNQYKDTNLNTLFYSDLRSVREHSYDIIKNNLYKPIDKDEEESKKYGHDVYVLDGDSFDMIIRGLSEPYNPNIKGLYRECYSLIDEGNLSRFGDEDTYYYGYNNVDTKDFLHLFENDSYSSNLKDTTDRINRIMTTDEISEIQGYSELQIKTIDGKRLPDYLVCFNNIYNKDIENAKLLGIPIVLIYENMYKQREEYKHSSIFEFNNYIMNDYDLEKSKQL